MIAMVDIDSNAILVEPIKSCKDTELTREYRIMMTRLKRARIIPKKHSLDNEVSEAIKKILWDEYHMDMELAPLGCHCRNAT